MDAITVSWAGAEGIGAEASRCWSEKFVDTVGVELLAEARSCINRGVDDAMMRDFVITSMVGGAEQAANRPDGMVTVVFSCAYGIDLETLLDDADG